MSQNLLKGSLFAILAFFCMGVFGILTKIACESGESIWVSFITYSIASIATAFFILPHGLTNLKSQHYSYLIARAAIGTTASFLYMISMHFIPIINSTLLFNTAPIFIPFLTVFWLKTSVSKTIWYAVTLGFIGILCIIKPGMDIVTDPGNIIGLLSGLSLAIAYMFMKTLTATDSGLRIIFYYFGIGTLMQIPLLLFTKQSPSLVTFFNAGLCGLVLMAAQLFLVQAYKYASASEVGVYQYTSIVFVGILEWFIWARTPGLLDYIGFVLVSVAGIMIISSGKLKH
jgi:drug/metabolite transporter (DMT)-like permease